METETPDQIKWRKEFESWPETKLRMFSEPTPNAFGFDERKAFARAILAEREADKRDAREVETLRIARLANKIAIAAIIVAVVSAISTAIITKW